MTHLAVAVLGAAAVVAVLSSASRKNGTAGLEKAPAGLATTSRGHDSGEDAAAGSKLSVADLRQMLADSAAIPMLRHQRTQLKMQLLEEWSRIDPEGLLNWQAEHPWLDRYRVPLPTELAAHKPELVYQWAVAHGDPMMMEHLISANPLAALDLMRRAGVKPSPRDLDRAFTAGVQADPDFVKHLQDLSDPAMRKDALGGIESSFSSHGRYAELGKLWRDHPERINPEALASALGGDVASGLPPNISWLLPGTAGTTDPVDPTDPFQILGYVGQLQQAYLPQGGEEDWRKLISPKTGEEEKDQDLNWAALQAAARGERSPEILAAVVDWWLAYGDYSQPSRLNDPALRDAAIEKMLMTSRIVTVSDETESDVRQRLLGQITDGDLRKRMESWLAERERKSQEDIESGEDPFADKDEER